MAGVLSFKVELKTIPVELEYPGSEVVKGRLTELLASDLNDYRDKAKDRVKLTKEGKYGGVTSYKGAQSDLLGKALLHEDGTPFSRKELDELPGTLIDALFAKAQELNGLSEKEKDAEAEDAEGND